MRPATATWPAPDPWEVAAPPTNAASNCAWATCATSPSGSSSVTSPSKSVIVTPAAPGCRRRCRRRSSRSRRNRLRPERDGIVTVAVDGDCVVAARPECDLVVSAPRDLDRHRAGTGRNDVVSIAVDGYVASPRTAGNCAAAIAVDSDVVRAVAELNIAVSVAAVDRVRVAKPRCPFETGCPTTSQASRRRRRFR